MNDLVIVDTSRLRGGRGVKSRPKGRQVDAAAHEDVRALLGDAPRERSMLIEFLHLVQDRYGHISAQHVAALADEMRLPQTEVYEVATFYAHFDVVKEGDTPPPPLTIRVCDSLTCSLMGGEAVLKELEATADPARVRVLRAPCMGRCYQAPNVDIGHRSLGEATAEEALARWKELPMPVLVLQGAEDEIADPAVAQRLARPGVEVVVLPDKRHDLLHERGATEVIDRVVSWLARK